jgi:hypothetical protein
MQRAVASPWPGRRTHPAAPSSMYSLGCTFAQPPRTASAVVRNPVLRLGSPGEGECRRLSGPARNSRPRSLDQPIERWLINLVYLRSVGDEEITAPLGVETVPVCGSGPRFRGGSRIAGGRWCCKQGKRLPTHLCLLTDHGMSPVRSVSAGRPFRSRITPSLSTWSMISWVVSSLSTLVLASS